MPSDFIDDFMNGDVIEAVHVHQTFEPIHNLEDGSAFYADDIGTVNAYKVDFSTDNKVSTYTKGLVVNFKSLHANTGASTLTIAGPTGDLDPIALTKRGGELLVEDDIAEGQIISAIYTEDEDENLDPINPRFEVIGGLSSSLSDPAWAVFSVLSSDLTLTDLSDQDLPLGSRLDGDQLSINGNQRVTLEEGLYNVAFTVTCEINSGEALEVGLFDYSDTTPVEVSASTRAVIGHETLHQSPNGEAIVCVAKGSTAELGLRTGGSSVDGTIKAGGGYLKIIKVDGGVYSSSGSVYKPPGTLSLSYDESVAGYLRCNGQVLAQSAYPALFSAIGLAPLMAAGATWYAQSSFTNELLFGVAYGNEAYVIVGHCGNRAFRSIDGKNWAASHLPTSDNLNRVAFCNGLFVATGGIGTILTSPDGLTWTQRTSGASTSLWGIANSPSTTVVVGNGGLILTSTDNVTWTSRTSPTTSNLLALVYGESLFVAVGASGVIITSSDEGVTWTSQTSGVSVNLVGISYGGGSFVAGGDSNTLITSSDAVTWTQRTVPGPSSRWIKDLGYTSGRHIAVLSYGTIWTSDNVTTWNERSLPIPHTDSFRAVCSGPGLIIAVGDNGVICHSPVRVYDDTQNFALPNLPGSDGAEYWIKT